MLNEILTISFNDQKEGFPSTVPYKIIISYDDSMGSVVYQDGNFNTLSLASLPNNIWLNDSSAPSGGYAVVKAKLFARCQGTTRQVYAPLYEKGIGTANMPKPYYRILSYANHFECVQVSCNVYFIGEPNVTAASTQTSNDGSISINAFGSGMRYAIKSFYQTFGKTVTGNLTYQTSNLFANLLPGLYEVFAKDINNCIATTRVVVPYLTGGYNTVRMYSNFFDYYGQEYRIELVERDNSGLSDEVELLEPPVQIRYIESDNIFERVVGSTMTVNFKNITHFQFLDLFDSERKYFRADLYKDPNGDDELVWSGFLVNNQYQEDFADPPYNATVTFNDGLGELNETDYTTRSGQVIRGSISRFQTVLNILKKIGIEGNLRISVDLELLGVSYDQTTQTPLHVDLLNQEVYQGKNCFEILGDIMARYNARIYSSQGAWWINRIYDNVRPFDYKEYDLAGNYLGSGTIDNYKILRRPQASGQTDDYYAREFPLLRLQEGLKTVTLSRESYQRQSILRNPDFEQESVYADADFGYVITPVFNWLAYNASGITTSIETTEYLLPPASIPSSEFLTGSIFKGTRENSRVLIMTGNSSESRVISDQLFVGFLPEDKYVFNFRYYLQRVRENEPWIKFKWRVTINFSGKIKYLTKQGTWENADVKSEATQTSYVSTYNSWQNISVEADNPFPSPTSHNLTVEIFLADASPDVVSDSWSTSSSVAGYDEDAQIIVKTSETGFPANSNNKYQYWARVDDEWALQGEVFRSENFEFSTTRIDDVFLSIYPGGEPPLDEFEFIQENVGDYYDTYEERLISGSLPRIEDASTLYRQDRDRLVYDYWAERETGTPLQLMRRTGTTNYDLPENITAKEILETRMGNTWVLDSTIHSLSVINLSTAIIDGIRPVTDLGGGIYQGKIYLMGGMEWDVSRALYSAPLIEMGLATFELNVDPGESNVDGENSKVVPPVDPEVIAGTGGAFSTAFSISYDVD